MKILIGISGSISAYKSIELARMFVKDGHQVRCVLTKGALEFLNPNLFTYLGIEQVYTSKDDFNLEKYQQTQSNVLHIELSKWMDIMLIAPASANTIAKMANGLCDDLLMSIFLATLNKPVFIAPAMNTNMLEHPMTQNNLKELNSLKHISFIDPESGELACADHGSGKLAHIEKIKTIIETVSLQKNNSPKKILISTGASISPLDPVRYLTNPSSGKTGLQFAKEYLRNGDMVTVVGGPNLPIELKYLTEKCNFQLIQATTTSQLKDIIINEFKNCDVYISSAAFCDIEFEDTDQKIKKDNLTGQLNYKAAPDILKEVLSIKKEHQVVIGFAAETNTNSDVFIKKWNSKPVNLLIGNKVESGLKGKQQQGFAQDQGNYYFVSKGEVVSNELLSKSQLAKKMVSYTNEYTNNKNIQ
jgi:phosphopantothenoylcysteine decarboxylase/phosphopantothenate--cysteine ligase